MALTPKQERFARLIALQGRNQSDAYRQAYDGSPYATKGNIHVSACQTARNPNVALRIAELRAASQERALVSAEAVLDELKQVGFAAISGKDIRPSDKVAALDKMAKILGLYRDAEDRDAAPARITQVTVVLSHGAGGTSTETQRIVDGASRVLEPS